MFFRHTNTCIIKRKIIKLPINPLKMESPKAEPIHEHLRDSFNIVKQQMLDQLNNVVL